MRFPNYIPLCHETGKTTATLKRPFWYVDKDGVTHHAKQGMVTDGLSIPRFCWRIIGAPYASPYLAAGIIHDAYCKDARALKQAGNLKGAKKIRRMADELFLDMLLYLDCPKWKAWAMFRGVRIGAISEGL